MEHPRFPSGRKRLLRHTRRDRKPACSAVLAFMTLSLVFTLFILHSTLSSTNSSAVSRRASSSTSRNVVDILQINDFFGRTSERKFGKTLPNDLPTDLWVEDTTSEDKAEPDVRKEEDVKDFEEDKQQYQELLVELEREDSVVKTFKENDAGDAGSIAKSNVLNAVNMPAWVRDSVTAIKFASGSAQVMQQSMEKRGSSGKTLPRWDPLELIGEHMKANDSEKFNSRSPILAAIKWDHLRGVVRQMGSLQGPLNPPQSRKAHLFLRTSLLPDSRRSSLSEDIESIDSEDEPLDQNVIDNLEKISTIDDALLLRVEKSKNINLHSWIEKKLKMDMFKKEKSSKGSVDMLNPLNNPLLQDPDTSSPNGLSGNDRAILKALRKAVAKDQGSDVNNTNTVFNPKVNQDLLAVDMGNRKVFRNSKEAYREPANVAERAILELSKADIEGQQDTHSVMIKHQFPVSHRNLREKMNSSSDTRKWGFYPGLESNLGFSDFMEQFLEDKKCSHQVFMVWTTPPWTYTTRYQRGLESVFYFHPHACIVVLSFSMELNFFANFADQGFRVAVVVPNLEELLAGTPAEVFSSFWLPWTKTMFFHIHYSELIRLAVLYRYGGIYLDTDVVLLRPLVPLHNTIGAEKVENGHQILNGAVMIFEKHSVFLWECLQEFTETYDDQLLEFNGAELVTRVAHRMSKKMKQTSGDHFSGDITIEEPHVFFPLSRVAIASFFEASVDERHRLQMVSLLESIYKNSSMLHLWNQKTRFLVPQVSSLVDTILNKHCIKCNEYS